MSLEEIEAEIKKLNLKDRAALAKWIVESLDDLSEAEVEALLVEEAERRLDDMESGQVNEIPAKEVLRRARARHLAFSLREVPPLGSRIIVNEGYESLEIIVTGNEERPREAKCSKLKVKPLNSEH